MTDDHETSTLLSQDEVMAILDKMEGEDQILVGGQSVNVWTQHYAGRHHAHRTRGMDELVGRRGRDHAHRGAPAPVG